MAYKPRQQQDAESADPGKKLYSKMVRMFREGYISVVVYKNKYARKTFYDIVFFRKVKVNGKSEWRRGANFKPTDMPDLAVLLPEVEAFCDSLPDANT
jgi:hypothetical protein